MTADQDAGGPHLQLLEQWKPEREQATESRILDGEAGRGLEVPDQELPQAVAIRLGDGPPQVLLRDRPRVVPGRAERRQQLVVEHDHVAMLPEPGLVVGMGGQQVLAELGPQQVDDAGERGRTAAVHAQHEQGETVGGIHRIHSGFQDGGLAPVIDRCLRFLSAPGRPLESVTKCRPGG